LAFGLVYGYTHNISLQKQADEKHAQQEYHRKELLIEQAKAAYAKQQVAATGAVAPVVSSSARKYFALLYEKRRVNGKGMSQTDKYWGKKGVAIVTETDVILLYLIVDVESPDFDFEKFVAEYEK
jgi:F-type H+-transporting ATP synthase subunit e